MEMGPSPIQFDKWSKIKNVIQYNIGGNNGNLGKNNGLNFVKYEQGLTDVQSHKMKVTL